MCGFILRKQLLQRFVKSLHPYPIILMCSVYVELLLWMVQKTVSSVVRTLTRSSNLIIFYLNYIVILNMNTYICIYLPMLYEVYVEIFNDWKG